MDLALSVRQSTDSWLTDASAPAQVPGALSAIIGLYLVLMLIGIGLTW